MSILRGLPSLTGDAPAFEVSTAPATPAELFEEWLGTAVAGRVVEPQSMTLSTVDEEGMPDARVLILKAIDPAGRWAFASSAASAKGRELAANPHAALTFWWPEQVRSVRIRGSVAEDDPATSAADFGERGISAKAIALSGEQSAPLIDPDLLTAEVSAAQERLRAEPGLIHPAWRRYWVTASAVEFWQGETDRRHQRLQYLRQDGGWTRQLLRP